MNPLPHDFTKPPRLPPHVKNRLVPWMNRAHSVFIETMGEIGVRLQSSWLDCQTGWPLETLENWEGRPLAFRAFLNEGSSIVAFPNLLAQALAGTMLGEAPNPEATERVLSPVESSLCEFALTTFFASLREVWIEELPLTLDVRGTEPNLRRSKIFRPNDALLLCRSTVKIREFEFDWTWILRLEPLFELFKPTDVAPVATPTETNRQQIESLVRGMSLPLTVHLGHVRLSAPQLAELQIGDVVILDQQTSEPLKGFVSGQPTFLGWPGRLEEKQAFQIESEIKSRRVAS